MRLLFALCAITGAPGLVCLPRYAKDKSRRNGSRLVETTPTGTGGRFVHREP